MVLSAKWIDLYDKAADVLPSSSDQCIWIDIILSLKLCLLISELWAVAFGPM